MNDMYIPNSFHKIKTNAPKLDTRVISRINITGVSFVYNNEEIVPEYMSNTNNFTFDAFINKGEHNIIVYFLNISSSGVNNVYFEYNESISKWNISCLFGSVMSWKAFSYDQVTKNQYYNIPFNNDGSSLDWGGPTFTCVFE